LNEHSQSGQASNANYHAYLLRLWREGSSGPWRVMLQDAATGQRHGFAGLTAFWLFLRTQTGECTSCSDEPALPLETHQEEENHA
jgi:hypothetical protein